MLNNSSRRKKSQILALCRVANRSQCPATTAVYALHCIQNRTSSLAARM